MGIRRRMLLRVVVATVLAASVSVAAARGGGGGRSGDSGDSSMNPFTGDSYAYFHCGHNLGEEGMIIPGRPNPQDPAAKARRQANAAAPTPECAAANPSGTPRDQPSAERERNPR